MCGIAGIVALRSPLEDADVDNAKRMTHILRHRGPDATGYGIHERCVLGNTRLKILDLSDNANLPMTSADGSIEIAYNGEVTNFRELIQEFGLDKKYDFRTSSDTEVLIHLYEELGIDFVNQLSGMFAFALFDKRKQKLFLVRDFFGIRPVFFMVKNGRFHFASEIKSFLQLPYFDDALNLEAIYHYFGLAYIPDRLTPFRDIEELQGGHLVEVDLRSGELKEREYYQFEYKTDPTITEQDIITPLRREMRDAVRRNLISDAPLGLTLSGGFDTGSILALAHDLDPSRPLHTFSIVMDQASYDESHYQQILVDRFKPIHHSITVGPEQTVDYLIEHMAYLDEPSGDGACVPSYLLAKEATKYVSVLLSGEGGDEMFNAYETHAAYKARRLYRAMAPRRLRDVIRRGVHKMPCSYNKLSPDFVAKRFVDGCELDEAEAHHHWRHVLLDSEQRRLLPGLGKVRPTEGFFADTYDSVDFPDGLNRVSLIDLKYFFIGDLMVKNDRTFMAHSVEARFPYMDRKLFELVSTIPPELRLKGFKRRYIQKQAVKKLMPREIYRRQNMGLEMPHSHWFMGEFSPLFKRYLNRKTVEKTDLLSYDAVRKMKEDHLARRKDYGRALWCVVNFLIWFDLFVGQKNYTDYLHRSEPVRD
jgi:asparagine synthase (glutamine-hydrolysing)